MNKPVRTSDDRPMPLAASIAIGGLALLGAITLVGWVIGALMGFVKAVIIIVVALALISWIAGRRLGR